MKALIAAAAIVLAACGCQPRAVVVPPHSAYGATAPSWTGTGTKVAVFGDSLTLLAWTPLYQQMATDHAVKIAAWWGEGWDGGKLSDADGSPTPIEVAAATTYATDQPAVVVDALGTNTVWKGGDLPLALRNQRAALAGFKDACKVAVTIPINPGATEWDSTGAAALNADAATWADVTVDWAGAVAADPSLLGSDHVHTTATGTALRAQLIDKAVRTCTTTTTSTTVTRP